MRYLSSLAEAEIDELLADGVNLSPVDIVRINALCNRVENPQARLALSRGTPVAVGGVYLWPMTLAAEDWFQRVGCKIGGQKKQAFALAYAMANGRDILPQEIKEARLAVVKWGRSLKCRYTELVEAIRIVHEQWETIDTGEKGPPASVGELSMMLAAMTGIPAETWEYQCSIQYVVEMISTITAQNAADGESTKHDLKIKAERAVGLVISKIKKKHEKSLM